MKIKDLFKKSESKKIKVINSKVTTPESNNMDNVVGNNEPEIIIADRGRVVGQGGNGVV